MKANTQSTQPDHEFQISRKRTGATILLESLVKNGVDTVFGFPGGYVIPLYDELIAFEQAGVLRHILTRHEQGAIHAAEGYARVTGKPGVVFATSGPGASNLITGMMDAHLDSTPLVIIGGQVVTELIGKDAFQECDMMGMTNPITKHNFQCRDVNHLEEVMAEAFHLATTGRPGPVYVDLPKDVQQKSTRNGRSGALDLPFYISYRPAESHAVKRAATLIRNAKRPLIVAGQGVVLSDASTVLRELVARLDIPVGTTILAKGVVDDRDRRCVGTFGMHGRRVANYAVAKCDVIVAVGCRFSDRITGEPKAFARGKKIVHIDIDSYEIGKNVPAHVELNCDAKEALEALLTSLDGFAGDWTEWTESITKRRIICNRCVKDKKTDILTPKDVMSALNKVLAPTDVVTTGVGQHQMFATHYLYRQLPRTFVTSGGAGTMGFGLPAAIGASVGAPDVTVFAVDGDGSLQMTIQELGTLATLEGKVALLILDNGYLGMVRQWQELFLDRRYSQVKLPRSPDFVKIAEAYGIAGRFVNTREGLADALAAIKAGDKSMVLHIAVEPESNIEPMIPPGGKVTDFGGYCIQTPGRFFSESELSDSDERGDVE